MSEQVQAEQISQELLLRITRRSSSSGFLSSKFRNCTATPDFPDLYTCTWEKKLSPWVYVPIWGRKT